MPWLHIHMQKIPRHISQNKLLIYVVVAWVVLYYLTEITSFTVIIWEVPLVLKE